MTPTRILSPANRCRVCGCTDLNACVIDPTNGDVLTEETLTARIAEQGYRYTNTLSACYWVEPDLCSCCLPPAPETAAVAPPLYFTRKRTRRLELEAAILLLGLFIAFGAWLARGGR